MLAIEERPASDCEAIAAIPIAFPVDRRFVVDQGAEGSPTLREAAVPEPFIKDYDADERPTDWRTHFDLHNWGLLIARMDGTDVGSVLVAFDTPGVDMLEGRSDLAVVWDIRVAPAHRGRGIGGRLIEAAETWARSRGCTELKVETQDINVAACSLYSRAGFRLREANPAAYPDQPNETQLIWTKRLIPEAS